MTNSIKAKIVLFYMAVLFSVLSAFGVLLYFSLVKIIYNAIDSDLISRSKALATLVQDNDDESEFNFSDDVMWEYHSQKSKSFFQIRLSDGTILEKSESIGTLELPYTPQKAPVTFQTFLFKGEKTRMINFRISREKDGPEKKRVLIIQCAEDINDSLQLLKSYRIILSVAGLIIMLISSSGGFLIARKGLQPVKDISRTISRISESNLSERIVMTHIPTELKSLAIAFNHAFDSLEKSFNRQKQFVSDVSHELRTPLAVILSQSEITLRKQRSAAEYQEVLAGIFEASQLMSHMVQKLLTLARLGADKVELRFEPVDLNEVISDALKILKPLALQRAIAIELPDIRPGACMVSGDRAALLEVFMNLIDNAIKYNITSGKIAIAFRREQGAVTTDITDTGVGIPENDLDRVCDRFYRVDKSRSKKIDGIGLGLSICDDIVKLHGGSISIRSQLGKGSTISVRLAAAQHVANSDLNEKGQEHGNISVQRISGGRSGGRA